MKKSCSFFIAGATYGALAALFFARESGSDLRKKLEKSKNPVRDFLCEIIEIKLDALKWIEEKGREMIKR